MPPRRRIFSSRRRELPAWLAIALLIAAVLTVSGIPYLIVREGTREAPPGSPVVTLQLPPGVSLGSLREGRVENVVDGDTIDVRVDGQSVRVRYFGVDTPERGDRCYREATERNRTLIGDSVLLLPDARDSDRFGRSLRYVFSTSGVSVDATLVAEGYGLAWKEDGRYREEIIALEEDARAEGRGCLWERN